jgi:flagellin
MADSVERLSSGLRINRARDDAAGLGIANALTSQINGANQGVRNLNNGISMVQTAEGAIAAASEMGQRIVTLATQGANSTLGTNERSAIKDEMLKLIDAIDSIKQRTNFSGNPLLRGDTGASSTSNLYSLQISNNSADKMQLKETAFADIGSTASSSTAVTQASDLVGANTVYVTKAAGTTGYSRSDIRIAAATADIQGNTNLFDGARSVTGKLYTLSAGVYTVADSSAGSATAVAAATYLYENNGNGNFTKITKANLRVVASDAQVVAKINLYDAADNVINGATAGDITGLGLGASAGRANDLLTKISNISLTDSTATVVGKFQIIQTAADAYVKALTDQRSLLGAYQNQIDYTVSNVTDLSGNLSAAKSRVIDTDYAAETANLTKGQILQQAATAMLAQANQMPNVILTLLK